MSNNFSVLCKESEYQKKSEELSNSLEVPLFFDLDEAEGVRSYLYYKKDRLYLFNSDSKKEISLDFVESYTRFYKSKGFAKQNPLVKAVGGHSDEKRCLWDMTAGLCNDSLIFLGLGFEVFAFEREKSVYALSLDALLRTQENELLKNIFTHLNIENSDSSGILQENREAPDVIYLDPMYPEKKKSALPSKEMQILQLIASETKMLEEFLLGCIKKARQRVVIKRPLWAKVICQDRLTHSYEGKAVRFDMYRI